MLIVLINILFTDFSIKRHAWNTFLYVQWKILAFTDPTVHVYVIIHFFTLKFLFHVLAANKLPNKNKNWTWPVFLGTWLCLNFSDLLKGNVMHRNWYLSANQGQ